MFRFLSPSPEILRQRAADLRGVARRRTEAADHCRLVQTQYWAEHAARDYALAERATEGAIALERRAAEMESERLLFGQEPRGA